MILLPWTGCSPSVSPSPSQEESRRAEPARPSGEKPAGTVEGFPEGRGAQPAPQPSAAQAQGWGSLKARFLFDGQPPPPKPIKITADVEFCGKQPLFEEDLVVNPANRGVANVLAWFHVTSRRAPPPSPESQVSTQPDVVYLDCKGCRFEPHVCLLRTDQTLLLRNLNPIGDSVKIDTLFNPGLNIMLPIENEMRHQFREPERLPARVSCTVHPWESGWLLVQSHPYMAVSDKDGRLRMEPVPAGRWTVQFWHEKSGPISQAMRAAGPVRWARGRAELDLQPGENDLGDILLAPGLFRESPAGAGAALPGKT